MGRRKEGKKGEKEKRGNKRGRLRQKKTQIQLIPDKHTRFPTPPPPHTPPHIHTLTSPEWEDLVLEDVTCICALVHQIQFGEDTNGAYTCVTCGWGCGVWGEREVLWMWMCVMYVR